jgi:hypothetical protein
MSQLKQKFMRNGPNLLQHPAGTTLSEVFRRPLPVEVNEEALRYGTENLLTFTSLLACPLPVREDYEEACKQESGKVRI